MFKFNSRIYKTTTDFTLICLFVSLEDGLDRHPNDAQVEPEAPVLDIPDVALHTTLHLPQLTGLTAEARHLCPAGDTGLDEVAHHILVYQFVVLFRMGQHVRPWSHDAHVADQHVPELWQFVDVGLANEITEGELARIVLGGLQAIGIGVDVHGWRKNTGPGL